MTRYAVLLHPSFKADARAYVRDLKTRGLARAAALVEAIAAAKKRLQRLPESAPRVALPDRPEANHRRLVLGETGYLLFFEVEHARGRVIFIRSRAEKQRPIKVERRRPPKK